MIILITGASHTGKTFLAQRLIEKYHYACLSMDHLKMGLIRSGYTTLTPEDDDELTNYLWPVVREIIKTAIENRQNLIVEGCYVPFDWRQSFEACYLDSIRFICLAMTDNYIDSHFDDIWQHACDIEHRINDSDCTPENMKVDNKLYVMGFKKYGEQITWIDDNYFKATEEILENINLNDVAQVKEYPTSIGLKRGTVYLSEHQISWEENAKETIDELYAVLHDLKPDIQHVGSTSINSIKAKPIIDIAVAVSDFEAIIAWNDMLAEHDIIFRLDERPEQLLFVKGDFEEDTRTHHIHVVLKNSREWMNYLNFRDYLNANHQSASEYEAMKEQLAARYPNDRNAYTEGKREIITRLLLEAEKWRGDTAIACSREG